MEDASRRHKWVKLWCDLIKNGTHPALHTALTRDYFASRLHLCISPSQHWRLTIPHWLSCIVSLSCRPFHPSLILRRVCTSPIIHSAFWVAWVKSELGRWRWTHFRSCEITYLPPRVSWGGALFLCSFQLEDVFPSDFLSRDPEMLFCESRPCVSIRQIVSVFSFKFLHQNFLRLYKQLN